MRPSRVPAGPPRHRGEAVIVYLRPEQHASLRAEAGLDHLPCSTWVRQVALREVERRRAERESRPTTPRQDEESCAGGAERYLGDAGEEEIPAGLERRTGAGAGSYRCLECRAWAHEGQQLRHSSRCASRPQIAPPATAPVAEDRARALRDWAHEGTLRLHATDDEIVEAVRYGLISAGDAENQDF